MKILFLNPPFFSRFSRESRSPAVAKSDTLYFPKWLCHAAAFAEQEGFEIDVVDAPAWSWSHDETLGYIKNESPDLLVMETSTPSAVNDFTFSKAVKGANPDLTVMLVGRHVSTLAENSLVDSGADLVALREYEITVAEVAAAIRDGNSFDGVLGIVRRDENGSVVREQDRPALENLDELPWVSPIYKRFLNIEDYFYGHSLHPLVVFDTSRGCPYHCSFCVYPQTFSGHKMRYRSVEHVVGEFRWVRENLPTVRTVMLEDDTFIINKKRTAALAEALIADGNTLPFDSNCRVDVGVDQDFMNLLHKAGARLFCVGFESGSSSVISHMDKNNNHKQDSSYLQTAREFATVCNRAGIKVHGCFMFGNLNETPESLEETLNFSLSLPLDTAQFFPIMVYPGTAAYDEAKQRGLLRTEDYSQWLTSSGLHASVVDLPNLSAEDLVIFADKARRRFYLRPKYLASKLLQSFTDLNEFRRNLKGFKKLAHFLWNGSDIKRPHEVKSNIIASDKSGASSE